MENLNLIKNLETIGKKYESEHLSIWENSQLKMDSWTALKFFFNHSFMRGRRDKLSVEYYTFTVKVLEEDKLFENLKNSKDNNLFNTDIIRKLKKERRNSIEHERFDLEVKQKNSLINALTTEIEVDVEFPKDIHYKKNICIQNDTDLLMVLDTLNFISEEHEKQNIYNYFYNLIDTGDFKRAHNELINLSGVGDKLSTFFLRDIAIINGTKITAKQIEFIFPVDTWVAQITTLISDKKFSADKPNDIKEYYIKNFHDSNFPLIAAGLWYLAYNSLEYAIQYVKAYKI